jgi:hypothetical protein
VDQYQALARDLIDAYGPGDPASLDRIIKYFRAELVFTWDRPSHDVQVSRLRKGVLDRLGDRRSAWTTDTSLAPDDACWLVARSEGFERWEDLVAAVTL